MINFLHTFQPSPVLISFGPIHIYWYGFFIVLGIILAALITIKLASYYNISKNTIIDLLFWLILSGLIGARIYHIFLELPYYLNHPLNIFKIWNGGLAIHGSIISGMIIIWIFAKHISPPDKACPLACLHGRQRDLGGYSLSHQKNFLKNFWLLSAIIAPGLALAQAIGRWGNYFNQELFGKPTDFAWGIPIDIANRPLEYINYVYFHPTFLYESIGNFLIFLILILIHIWIIKKQMGVPCSVFHVPCSVFCVPCSVFCVLCYLILYSFLRFATEFLRLDPALIIFGLRWPQLVSLVVIVLSLIFLSAQFFRSKQKITS